MFHVDPSDPTPVDVQLVRTIRSAIGAGLLSPGDEIPTVRKLAVDLRVNPNAIERALTILQRDGTIELRRGVGVFVRASPADVDREVLIQELSALEDTLLRAAAQLGFSLDDVIIHLDSRRRKG
ncbi:MAG TPA: GntR family transcriptional regulator [Longimicrobiaceae bacterium]